MSSALSLPQHEVREPRPIAQEDDPAGAALPNRLPVPPILLDLVGRRGRVLELGDPALVLLETLGGVEQGMHQHQRGEAVLVSRDEVGRYEGAKEVPDDGGLGDLEMVADLGECMRRAAECSRAPC